MFWNTIEKWVLERFITCKKQLKGLWWEPAWGAAQEGKGRHRSHPWVQPWQVTPLFVCSVLTHCDAPQLRDNTDELEPVQERATRRGLETRADAERIKQLGAADFFTICYFLKQQAQVLPRHSDNGIHSSMYFTISSFTSVAGSPKQVSALWRAPGMRFPWAAPSLHNNATQHMKLGHSLPPSCWSPLAAS